MRGHQSAAVKGQNKHFYCDPSVGLLSLASCSLKINILGAGLSTAGWSSGSGLVLRCCSTGWDFIALRTLVIGGLCVVMICVTRDL